MHCYSEEQRMAHERAFIEQTNGSVGLYITDRIEHPSGIKKGDMAVVRNGRGNLVGPYKVLGFTVNEGKQKMYLDWDCWWHPIPIERIFEIRKEAENE